MTTRRHQYRRWWLAGAGAVVILAGALLLVRFVLYRDTTTAVTSDEVLARYRASTVVPAPEPPTTVAPTSAAPVTTAPADHGLPEPGVYQYSTTGQEEIDALGGTTHAYPAMTAVTVTTGGCGVITRWDALEERWNSRHLCRGEGGIVSGTYSDFHRFYGQDDLSNWTCDPPYVLVPDTPQVGASWTGHCTAGTNQEDTSISVIAVEDVQVGGRTASAVHIQRVEKDQDSSSTALSTTDQWFEAGTGLVLREIASSTSTTASPIGDVHYREQYELRLTSLDPRL